MPKLSGRATTPSTKGPVSARPGRPPARRRKGGGPETARRGTPLPAGFLAVCLPLARDLARRRAVFIAEPDAVNVHALRGAARRLQAAISLFDAVLHPRDARWMQKALKALAGRLGRLRDLDVFLERLAERPQESHGPKARVRDALSTEATLARRAECEMGVAALRSARATILVDGLEAWLFEAAGDLRPEVSLSAYARPCLKGLHERVEKAGRHLTRLGARRRHALRSQVKMLRYSAEAIAQIDGVGTSDSYLAALIGLSHQLGDLNDDEVGARLATELSDGGDVSMSRRLPSGTNSKTLAAAWAAFVAAPPSWQVRPGR